MAGTFLVNFLFSIFGFLLYFSLSYSKYYPFETFIHSLIVALLFWISGYVVRYLFGKSLQSFSEETRNVPSDRKFTSAKDEIIQENDQPLSEDDIEQVSKYIKDLINNE
ncbi:hypothetical protein [Peribacillus acanthi]|uniref:hypothetical protein n=1 Tax=Peribacillus acanthi TaxID=2171554 RepID=UPI000D3EDFFF|nr:hypothetical protein [Peribacillus acanthi]